MKTLFPRVLFMHFPSPSALHLTSHRLSLIFLHSVSGEEAHRRRPESFPASPPSSIPSSHPFHSSSPSSRRHHEEESRNVKVSVWWDFENCNIPMGVNVFRVANRITSALRSTGIKGPVTITAFGDVAQLSRATQEALTSTGVCLNHVPHSGKNSSDRSFIADLVYWVSLNPPPVHFFLISGDRDFANILHRLRMSNYNILLASTDTAPGVLCSAATMMWPWSALVKGENISVKHFNHPPDGLYGSWYGYYKGVHDDPFSGLEQAANSQPDEYMESISETKPRTIPKAVVNGIRRVLCRYPEGINLSELHAELKRNNIIMDKDFFGYKKFSRLLNSMPNFVRFIPPPSGEGQPLVIGTHRRITESVEPSPTPAKDTEIRDGDQGCAISRNGKPSEVSPPTTISEPSPNRKETDANAIMGNSTVPQGHEVVVEGRFKRFWKTFIGSESPKAESSPSRGTDMDTFVGASTSQQQNEAAVEEGLFRSIWKTLNGSRSAHSKDENGTIRKEDSATGEDSNKDVASVHSCKHSEKAKSEEKKAASSKKDPSGLAGCGLSSSDAGKSLPKNKTVDQLEEHIGAANVRMGFFSRMASRWRSWKSGARGQEDSVASIKEVLDNEGWNARGESVKALTNANCRAEVHDLFSKAYFWVALESFLVTSKGSDVIFKSRTREQLAKNLQKEGPWVLKDLKENHLLQLVDLLISEKKWVEESASQTFPLKAAFPAKRCVPSHAHVSKGLSSLFSGRMSQSSLQSLPEQGKQEQISMPLGSSYNESVDSKPPQNFSELKAWFLKTFNATEGVKPEDFKKLFESTFDMKLLCSSYGYSTVRSLITACSADNAYKQGNMKRPSSREEVLSDCHRLLKELLEEYPDGFNMSIVRPSFIQRYGYVLDYQMLGYPKLVSLLQIMPGLRIESPYILAAERFSDSSLGKQARSETLFDCLEDDKEKVISKENEGKGNGEEHIWEELGPVSDTVIHEDSNLTEEMDKHVSFDEASLSDEEFTDTEDDTPRHFDESEGKSRKNDEGSSLLQILDSWYSSKEAGEKEQAQAVDGLVDCSRSNDKNPVDLKPKDSQIKVRTSRRYSFVSVPKDDEKEKLVESILGSLKKAGDSRLQS